MNLFTAVGCAVGSVVCFVVAKRAYDRVMLKLELARVMGK